MQFSIRTAFICLLPLMLTGCWEYAVVELGGQLVIAGIAAVADAANDDSSSSSTSSVAAQPAPKGDQYCRKVGTNLGYIPAAHKCDNADHVISSTEYYSTAIVRPSAGSKNEVTAYCYDAKLRLAYTATSGTCQSSDTKVAKSEYDKYRAEREAEKNKPIVTTVYCSPGSGLAPYEGKDGNCSAGHKKITPEQFKTEIAKLAATPSTGSKTTSPSESESYEVGESTVQYCRISKRKEVFATNQSKCPVGAESITSAEYNTGAIVGDYDAQDIIAKQVAMPAIIEPSTPATPDTASVPVVSSISGLEYSGNGTGFALDKAGHFLTNNHVISDCKGVALLTKDGFIPAAVLKVDEGFDLALLSSEYKSKSSALFRSTSAELGEVNYVIGYPMLDQLLAINVTNGIISSTTGLDADIRAIQTTAAVQPGNSGGPMVDESGVVLGVVFARYKGSEAQNVNWAVRSEAVQIFLDGTGVEAQQANRGPAKKPNEIVKSVRAYTVPIACFN